MTVGKHLVQPAPEFRCAPRRATARMMTVALLVAGFNAVAFGGQVAADTPTEVRPQPQRPISGAAPHPDIAPTPQPAANVPPEPDSYRMDDFRSPVPATLRGARVLTNEEAADLWNSDGAVFIDVYPQAQKPPNLPAGTLWRDPAHRSIEGASWMPNVGYGGLPDEVDQYFQQRLEALTKGDKNAPLVFFCLKECWMSWNAAKRAMTYGYSNVMWFPSGTDGWQELGYPLIAVKKLP